MIFRLVWVVDALIVLVVLCFFFVGLADGSVSSFNAGIWTALLLGLGAVFGGGTWLYSTGRKRSAVILLSVLAVPGLLTFVFILIVLISDSRWN